MVFIYIMHSCLYGCWMVAYIHRPSSYNVEETFSMSHSLLPILNNNIPILLPTMNAKFLSPFDHHKEHSSASHTNKGR